MAAVYLQVSIISQALIFVTRARKVSWLEVPGLLLLVAFILAQLLATFVAVYVPLPFARIKGCGWGWAGIIWVYSLITYLPLDVLKFSIRYILSGKAWSNLNNKTAFTTKRDYGRAEREAEWAYDQRTLHGLKTVDPPIPAQQPSTFGELSEIAEQARRRAEVARIREINTHKGHIEAVVKLKGLDIDNVPQHYTL